RRRRHHAAALRPVPADDDGGRRRKGARSTHWSPTLDDRPRHPRCPGPDHRTPYWRHYSPETQSRAPGGEGRMSERSYRFQRDTCAHLGRVLDAAVQNQTARGTLLITHDPDSGVIAARELGRVHRATVHVMSMAN